jgi:hypothetical protein
MDLHIGEDVHVRVTMRDAGGNVTDRYDVAGGIQWTSTDEAIVAVEDDDADPKDARVTVMSLGGPVRIGVSFDGDSGAGVRQVSGESEDLNVVPGDAVAGEVVVEIRAAPA